MKNKVILRCSALIVLHDTGTTENRDDQRLLQLALLANHILHGSPTNVGASARLQAENRPQTSSNKDSIGKELTCLSSFSQVDFANRHLDVRLASLAKSSTIS